MVFQIVVSVIFPIFLIIGLGVLLDRKLTLDLPTMSRLNFYVFVPALSFIKLLDADIPFSRMTSVGLFGLVHVLVLLALAWTVCSNDRLRDHRAVLSMSTILYNCANYGIPFTILAFGPKQIGLMATIVIVQTVLGFSLGLWLLAHKHQGVRSSLAGLLKVPVLHAIAAAMLIRWTGLRVPAPIYGPLNTLSDGLIPVALLTLGMQLSRTRLDRGVLALSVAASLRLFASPIIAALLIIPFHFTGTLAKVLIVAAGFPVGVNVYVLAAEYEHDVDLAGQAIFVTTLLSAVTMSVLLAIYH